MLPSSQISSATTPNQKPLVMLGESFLPSENVMLAVN
jgi:hypothetical protein